MHLKEALAGALRGARAHQGLSYEELAGATHRTYVGKLEQARANATLEKLDEIADYLGLDLLTMVTPVRGLTAYCLACQGIRDIWRVAVGGGAI